MAKRVQAKRIEKVKKVKETVLLQVGSDLDLAREDKPIGQVKKFGKVYNVYSNIEGL